MIDRPTAMRAAAAIALAAVLVPLGAGCRSHRTVEDQVLHNDRNFRDAMMGRTFHTDDAVELKTNGPLAVDIDNFSGSVVVRADRDVTSTFVEVRRVSKHGIGRWYEGYEALDDAQWTATLEPRAGGNQTLVVRTDTPNPEKHFHQMQVLVITPALDSVKIRTQKGDVTVIENQGAVDIETTRGDVRMMTPWPITGAVTIVTSDGTIDYRVRGESKGAFDCETVGGEVRHRCEFGKWAYMNDANDHDRFLATLNDGTNPIVLRTTDGNIRVAVVPDPTAVGIVIRDP